MNWENVFDSWIGIAEKLDHKNGRGNREDLFEHFTRDLAEHVMVSLATEYIGKKEVVPQEMKSIFVRELISLGLTLTEVEPLVDLYIHAFFSEGVDDAVCPEGKRNTAICAWGMGCSAVHLNKKMSIYPGRDAAFRGLGITDLRGNMLPTNLKPLAILEKDHIFPKSKRDDFIPCENNSQWLCAVHNRNWKADKITQVIPEIVFQKI